MRSLQKKPYSYSDSIVFVKACNSDRIRRRFDRIRIKLSILHHKNGDHFERIRDVNEPICEYVRSQQTNAIISEGLGRGPSGVMLTTTCASQ